MAGRQDLGNVFPLSFAQERVWSSLKESASPLKYNLSASFQFLGQPNIPAMEKSVHHVVSRNQMLRATIHEDINSGKLFQRICEPGQKIHIPIVDFRNRKECASADRSPEYMEYLRANLLKPFNLFTGPLYQFHIILLNSELTVVQFVVHHIVADGSGIHACEVELRSAYAEFCKEGQSGGKIFHPIKFQYTDFVQWERNEQDFSKDAEFWKSYLSGMSPVGTALPRDIPKDAPIPRSVGYPAQRYDFNWPESLSVALAAFANEMSVTPFVIILSAIKILVKCYTGDTGIPILIAKHGRTHPEVRNMIGHFINPLIVHTDLSVPKSFKELVQKVKGNLSLVYEHQSYPFACVLTDFAKNNKESANPNFPLMLTMTPKLNKGKDGEHTLTDYFEIDNGKLNREFTIQLQERDENFTGFVKYNPLIYKEKRIEKMMADWKYLIENGIKSPNSDLGSLKVSPPKM